MSSAAISCVTLVFAFGGALYFAYMALVDPAVTLYRDKARGRAPCQAQVPIGSGAELSRLAIELRPAPR